MHSFSCKCTHQWDYIVIHTNLLIYKFIEANIKHVSFDSEDMSFTILKKHDYNIFRYYIYIIIHIKNCETNTVWFFAFTRVFVRENWVKESIFLMKSYPRISVFCNVLLYCKVSLLIVYMRFEKKLSLRTIFSVWICTQCRTLFHEKNCFQLKL